MFLGEELFFHQHFLFPTPYPGSHQREIEAYSHTEVDKTKSCLLLTFSLLQSLFHVKEELRQSLWNPTVFSRSSLWLVSVTFHAQIYKMSMQNNKCSGVVNPMLQKKRASVFFFDPLHCSAPIRWMSLMSPLGKIAIASRRPGNANCN